MKKLVCRCNPKHNHFYFVAYAYSRTVKANEVENFDYIIGPQKCESDDGDWFCGEKFCEDCKDNIGTECLAQADVVEGGNK